MALACGQGQPKLNAFDPGCIRPVLGYPARLNGSGGQQSPHLRCSSAPPSCVAWGTIGFALHPSRLEELPQPPHAFLQYADRLRIRHADVMARVVVAEVEARRDRDAGLLEKVPAKSIAVVGEAAAVRVEVESALGLHRDLEPELLQRW